MAIKLQKTPPKKQNWCICPDRYSNWQIKKMHCIENPTFQPLWLHMNYFNSQILLKKNKTKQGDICRTALGCCINVCVYACVPQHSQSWSLIKLLLSPLQGHLRQLGSTVHEHLHFHIDHLTKHLQHTQRRRPSYYPLTQSKTTGFRREGLRSRSTEPHTDEPIMLISSSLWL